ncbi:MAG: AAA family ATPase, partial [Bryobacteraceae bacterium]
MLKLRKVEILGFKSFCEKTHITFSGNGLTCIVGPNGCGKSNIVDAISWVLGEQSHKSLRAERMADCIFAGTAKRPPLGMAEVIITLEDPELAEAGRFILAGRQEGDLAAETPGGQNAPGVPIGLNGEILAGMANPTINLALQADSTAETSALTDEIAAVSPAGPALIESSPATEAQIPAEAPTGFAAAAAARRKRAAKPAPTVKPGEVVIGRRLYRSGQSEYTINGRTARLRDVQEVFMGVGLGPDSYAIIEQGRIGQILSSKPSDRRA